MPTTKLRFSYYTFIYHTYFKNDLFCFLFWVVSVLSFASSCLHLTRTGVTDMYPWFQLYELIWYSKDNSVPSQHDGLADKVLVTEAHNLSQIPRNFTVERKNKSLGGCPLTCPHSLWPTCIYTHSHAHTHTQTHTHVHTQTQ